MGIVLYPALNSYVFGIYVSPDPVTVNKIPISFTGYKVKGGSVWCLCDNVTVKAGLVAYVKSTAACGHSAFTKTAVHVIGCSERYVKIFRHRHSKHAGDALQVSPYPLCIIGIVVISKLGEHCRRACKPKLRKGAVR